MAVIDVRGLTVEYRIGKRWLSAVEDVDLQINPLQIHGLVGESGSGKSTLGLAMLRFLAPNARIGAGTIEFGERDLLALQQREIEAIWGDQLALVPQHPMDALNPSIRISRQMTEITQLHTGIDVTEANERAIEALRHVQIPDPERVLQRYPHQLSGGMLQRVMIAMAMSTRPRLLILDEPTTALDVTTQAVILDLLRELIREEQAAALYVSHDLGTVAQLCDYVTVLYAGEVMESAPVADLFALPRHPYTVGLLACLPNASTGADSRLAAIEGVAPSLAARAVACVFADRCAFAQERCRSEKPPLEQIDENRTIRCWRWREVAQLAPNRKSAGPELATTAAAVAIAAEQDVLDAHGLSKRFAERSFLGAIRGKPPVYVRALNDVSVRVRPRTTFGIVGESGSGKTTFARSLVALLQADSGEIRLQDRLIGLRLRDRDTQTLRNIRIVFQNPNDSLNPYRSVGQTIGRTIAKLSADRLSREERDRRVGTLLEAVGLPREYASRRPGRLSGGEKQRVAIARAFAPNPALIVADEPTSSLDVSVQAVILNLLKDLRATEGASYIVISHDLEVVGYLADHIAVMYLGEIVEQGTTDAVLSLPSHPYTEALLSASPVPDPSQRGERIVLSGEAPSPRNLPTGCPFHPRCPRKIGKICETTAPPVQVDEAGHQIRCHHAFARLLELQSKAGAP